MTQTQTVNYISFFLALLPTAVIMFLVLRNVKHKKKPVKKFFTVFGISVLSCIPAMILEIVGELLLAFVFVFSGLAFGGSDKTFQLLYQLCDYILVVGVSEEACKFFSFKWMIFNDREFDNTYDGVVYGAASALGFATLENIMYVFLMSEDPIGTALLRAVLSIPLHAITGIFMGYYFGIAKYRRYNNIDPDSHPEIYAFIFSVLLHGTYDFVLTIPAVYGTHEAETLSILLTAAIMIFIYVLMGYIIHRAKKNIHTIYNRYYYEQLDGALQDMSGRHTTSTRRFFGFPFGKPFPIGKPMGYNPYYPYSGIDPPVPPPAPPPVVTPVSPQYQQGPTVVRPVPPQPVTAQQYTYPSAGKIICPNCMTELPDRAKFCAKCGKPVTDRVTAAVSAVRADNAGGTSENE